MRSIAREPDFKNTLQWLDPANQDDRLIASVLELQRAQPSAAVVLVTGDVNLQNKARAAALPFAEPPSVKEAQPKPWEGVVLTGDKGERYFDWGLRMVRVPHEGAPTRLTTEAQRDLAELLWQRDDASPQFDVDGGRPREWVYETDRGRTCKRKLRADFGEQYMSSLHARTLHHPNAPSVAGATAWQRTSVASA